MTSCFKGYFRLTSPRGYRTISGVEDYHKGIDLVGLDDITVYSVCEGVVKTDYQANGAGNYIVVTMPDGRRVFYMHLKSFLVSNGAKVKKGTPIGIMGNTGNSYGAHTHIELRPAGNSYDSLDINAFTGIKNEVGVYYYNPNESEKSDKAEMTQEKFDEMLEDYFKRLAALPPSEWSEPARKFCETHGIILGDGCGNMRYKSFVTREEVAEVATRIVTGLTNFSSVEKSLN